MGIYAATNTDPIPDRFRWFVSAGCNASWDDPEVRTTVTVTVTDRMAWHKKKRPTTDEMIGIGWKIWILIWFYIWWRLHWWLLSHFLVALTVLSSSSHTYIAIAKSMAFLQISELERHLPSRAPQDWRQTICWRSRGRWAEASSTCWRIYPGNSPPNDSSVIL